MALPEEEDMITEILDRMDLQWCSGTLGEPHERVPGFPTPPLSLTDVCAAPPATCAIVPFNGKPIAMKPVQLPKDIYGIVEVPRFECDPISDEEEESTVIVGFNDPKAELDKFFQDDVRAATMCPLATSKHNGIVNDCKSTKA